MRFGLVIAIRRTTGASGQTSWPRHERPQLFGVAGQLLHVGALGGCIGVTERYLHRMHFQAVTAAGGRGEAVGVSGPMEGPGALPAADAGGVGHQVGQLVDPVEDVW